MEVKKDEWMGTVDTLTAFFADTLVADKDGVISWTEMYTMFVEWQSARNGKAWNRATFKNRVSTHNLFAGMSAGKLRTAEGRVNGLRGVRARRASDAESVAPAPAPVAEQQELMSAENVPTPTPQVAPEREEVERRALVEEIEGLVGFVHSYPGGVEEVERLVEETGCTGPGASLGKLRAFKIRLEGALVRLSVQRDRE